MPFSLIGGWIEQRGQRERWWNVESSESASEQFDCRITELTDSGYISKERKCGPGCELVLLECGDSAATLRKGGRDILLTRPACKRPPRQSLRTLMPTIFSYESFIVTSLMCVIGGVLLLQLWFGQWEAMGGLISNISLFTLFFVLGLSLIRG